jgi:hypothetical protein
MGSLIVCGLVSLAAGILLAKLISFIMGAIFLTLFAIGLNKLTRSED